MTASETINTVSISAIRIDGGTQPRSEIDDAVVSEYAGAMQSGAEFPPVVVYQDGVAYWLADGFHRTHAARRIGLTEIAAEVRHGTQRDAILYSVGANAAHGLARSNADKRRAVMTLLQDEEWGGWSNVEIARCCFVHQSYVAKLRPSLSTNESEPPALTNGQKREKSKVMAQLQNEEITRDQANEKLAEIDPYWHERDARTYTDKHGNVSTMNTQNIGRKTPTFTDSNGVTRKPLEERVKEIAHFASQGYRSDQIADEINLSAQYIRDIANEHDIALPDRVIGKTHRIDPARIVGEMVVGLEGYVLGLSIIGPGLSGIGTEDAARWAQSLTESLRAVNRLHKRLKELAKELANV